MSRLSDEYIPPSEFLDNLIRISVMKLPPNQRNNQSVSVEKADSTWKQINQNAAGIDLGK